jgi:hypothetical protein
MIFLYSSLSLYCLSYKSSLWIELVFCFLVLQFFFVLLIDFFLILLFNFIFYKIFMCKKNIPNFGLIFDLTWKFWFYCPEKIKNSRTNIDNEKRNRVFSFWVLFIHCFSFLKNPIGYFNFNFRPFNLKLLHFGSYIYFIHISVFKIKRCERKWPKKTHER